MSSETIRILSTTEAARELGVTPWVLTQLLRTGKVKKPAAKFGPSYSWTPGEIEAARDFLATRPVLPKQDKGRLRAQDHLGRNGHDKKPALTPILSIVTDGIYTVPQITDALGLKRSSLHTEWKRGRLRVV